MLGIIGGLTTSLGVLADLRTATLGACVVGFLIAFMPGFASLSLRIGRLPMPHVPVDVEEFRRHDQPALDQEVLDQTGRADRILAALLTVAVIGISCGSAALLADHRLWSILVVVLAGIVLPVRSRSYIGVTQRGPLICAGAALLLATAAATLLPLFGDRLLIFLVGIIILIAAIVGYALQAPGRSPSPYWNRFLDFVEFLGFAAIFPIIAAVLDLYVWVRGLGG